MRHLDLFSGIGGFALAAHWAGYTTEVFCERDEYCTKILKKHWPDVPVVADIFEFDGGAYRGADLLTGGFPCQPYSCAGKRGGDSDDRALWPEMRRVIAEARPRWIVAENVPGLIGMALDGVLSDLEGEGYEVETVVLPACAVNAPHRRDRVWIVAHAASAGPLPGAQARVHRGEEGPGARHVESERRGEALAHADPAGRIEQRRAGATAAQDSAAERLRPCPFCGYRFDHEQLGKYGCPDCCGEGFDDGQFEPGLGRVADGLPARLDGHFAREPAIPRVATGVPNRTARLKALGNAIVPMVAYQIMRAIRAVDEA